MALDTTFNNNPMADALSEEELGREVDRISSSLATRSPDAAQLANDLRLAFYHINLLIEQHATDGERLVGLEDAARMAIDIVTVDSERKLANAVERAETRVVEALSLSEQHLGEFQRWRVDVDERVRASLRELGEWDESLTETRGDVVGLREMAEAALSLASGEISMRWEALSRDIDMRWDQLGRELREILATTEADERTRWEAFMSATADTLAVGEGGDPSAVEYMRSELVMLQEGLTRTTTNLQTQQQQQREHVAALRTELHILIESERSYTVTTVEQRLSDAQSVIINQTKALQDWQQQVGKDVVGLREMATGAEERARSASESMKIEAQTTLENIRTEIRHGVIQARAAAQAELDSVRAEINQVSFQSRAANQAETGAIRMDQDRALRTFQRQVQAWQTLALVLSVIALTIGLGAFAVSFLHLH